MEGGSPDVPPPPPQVDAEPGAGSELAVAPVAAPGGAAEGHDPAAAEPELADPASVEPELAAPALQVLQPDWGCPGRPWFLSGVEPPARPGGRKRKAGTSEVWCNVVGLRPISTLPPEQQVLMQAFANANRHAPGATHCCTHIVEGGGVCGAGVRLGFYKGTTDRYNPTNLGRHILARHPSHPHAIKSRESSEEAKKHKVKELSAGAASKPLPGVAGMLVNTSLARRRKACDLAMLKWLIYGTQQVHHSTMRCPLLIGMVQEALGDSTHKPVRPAAVSEWVAAEVARFENAARVLLATAVAGLGDGWLQVLTDAGWLKDKNKYLSISVQFVPPDFSENVVLLLDFQKFDDGSAEANVRQIDGALQHYGQSLEAVGSAAQDMAAERVARLLGKEVADCLLHQSDKLMRQAVGDLDKRKGGEVVNPLPEFSTTKKKLQSIGKYFRFAGKRWSALPQACAKAGCRVARPKCNTSVTRAAAWQRFAVSMLQIEKGLEVVHNFLDPSMLKGKGAWPGTLTPDEFEGVAGVEGVAAIGRVGVIAGQLESGFNYAHASKIKRAMVCMARAGEVQVIDRSTMSAVKGELPFSRKLKKVADMSAAGRASLQRLLGEAESRFCGGVQGGPVTMDDDEAIAQFLDLRCVCDAEKELTSSGRDVQQDFDRFVGMVMEEHMKGLPDFEDDEGDGACPSSAAKVANIFGAYLGSARQSPKKSAADKRAEAIKELKESMAPRWVHNWVTLGEQVKAELGKHVAAQIAAERKARAAVVAPDVEAVEDEVDDTGADDGDAALAEDAAPPPEPVQEGPSLGVRDEEVRLWAALRFEMGEHYRVAAFNRDKYGPIPAFARKYIGRLNSESHEERMISVGGQVVTTANASLGAVEIRNRVVARGNKKFMLEKVDRGMYGGGQPLPHGP